MRTSDGTITTFDPTGSIITQPVTINRSGEIAGTWFDSGSIEHGFVRSATGKITSFDASKAGGTLTAGINDKGVITGVYFDNRDHHGISSHGFIRTP